MKTKYMKTLNIFTLLNIVTMLFFGCIDYPIYERDYCNCGKIISLSTDWKERGDDIDIPPSYTVKVGDYMNVFSGISNSIEHIFPAGKYIINIWNETDHITISNMIATANYTIGELGWLFSGRREVMIEKDREHSFIIVMQQQIRQLTFELEVADNVIYRYSSISATLSGVAGTLNIDDGTHDTPTIIALTFAENPEDNRWKASVRLLGITGNSQTLTLIMNIADGHPSVHTFTSDLSSHLASFNNDKKTPLTLSARLDGRQSGGELIAGITDWIIEETSTGTAD